MFITSLNSRGFLRPLAVQFSRTCWLSCSGLGFITLWHPVCTVFCDPVVYCTLLLCCLLLRASLIFHLFSLVHIFVFVITLSWRLHEQFLSINCSFSILSYLPCPNPLTSSVHYCLQRHILQTSLNTFQTKHCIPFASCHLVHPTAHQAIRYA